MWCARAGVAATVVNDAVMVPADMIKQRLQVNQGQYRGVLDCVMQAWKCEGLSAFYRQAFSSFYRHSCIHQVNDRSCKLL